jgi:sugar/nucleoside kinase (ribokinase family)
VTPTGLFVGLTTFDLVHYVERFPVPDEKIQASRRWTGAGGPAANAAATFAALGGTPTLLTAVGMGPFGTAAADELAAMGVQVVDLAPRGELPTSSAVVDSTGQRTVVSTNAKGFDQDAMVENLCNLEAFDAVVIDSHYPALAKAALVRARRPSVPVVFDPGSDKPGVGELMAEADHIILSRGFNPSTRPSVLLTQVTERGIKLAALSAGAEPILAVFDDRQVEITVPRVTAVDTVGAGDVLHGAYAYYLTAGCSIGEALQLAAATAAHSCEHDGPRIAGGREN